MADTPFRDIHHFSSRPPIAFHKEAGAWLPNMSGGVVEVLRQEGIQSWTGPRSVSPDEIEQAREEGLPSVSVAANPGKQDGFVVRSTVQAEGAGDGHDRASNRILWPLNHRQHPQHLSGVRSPTAAAAAVAKGLNGVMRFDISPSAFRRDLTSYHRHNEEQGRQLTALRVRQGDQGPMIVHDYQNIGVSGDIFQLHTPVVDLATLKNYQVGRDDRHEPWVRVWQEPGVKAFYEGMTRYPLLALQRPLDMERLLGILNAYDPDFHANNPDLIDPNGTPRKMAMGKDGAIDVVYGPEKHRFVMMSQPVGTSIEGNLQEALHGEYDPKRGKGLDSTNFTLSTERKNNYERGEMNASHAKLCGLQDQSDFTLRDVLTQQTDGDGNRVDLLTPGHELIVSFQRADYTKNPMGLLQAVKDYFQVHPEQIGGVSIVLTLEPTRLRHDEFRHYANEVMSFAQELRENTVFGKGADAKKGLHSSLVVIPASINRSDILGLIRHPNCAANLVAALADGHNLTVGEAVKARADRGEDLKAFLDVRAEAAGHPLSWNEQIRAIADHERETGERVGTPLAAILSDGIGASDVLSGEGTKHQAGAFVMSTAGGEKAVNGQIAKLLARVIELRDTPEGRAELAIRHSHMVDALRENDGRKWIDTLLDVYEQRAKPLHEAQARGEALPAKQPYGNGHDAPDDLTPPDPRALDLRHEVTVSPLYAERASVRVPGS